MGEKEKVVTMNISLSPDMKKWLMEQGEKLGGNGSSAARVAFNRYREAVEKGEA